MNFLYVSLLFIGVLCVLVVVRAVFGPTIWDRLLCLSMLSAKIITAICIFALLFGKTYFLDVAMVFAVLSFIGNIFLSRFVKRRSTDA